MVIIIYFHWDFRGLICWWFSNTSEVNAYVSRRRTQYNAGTFLVFLLAIAVS